MPKVKSPILLLGAGTGEATCGILYLASYLRRHGVEAYVRLVDNDLTVDEMRATLEPVLAHVRPKAIGLSLKWFHHVFRAQQLAQVIKAIDPSIELVLGGNTATFYCKELLAWPTIDAVILGDGEVPLLQWVQGQADAANVVRCGQSPAAHRYIQSAKTADAHYTHFRELFLSEVDLASYSGWVAPGKGCAENCLYCSGTRGLQKATFGRAKPFLRPVESVQLDHQAVVPHTWQLRYDFSGSSPEFLSATWQGLDLSRHSTTYFLWGVPPPGLVELLASRFGRVFMVIDIGCFSERQRLMLMKRGVLKPCATDAALLDVVRHVNTFANVALEISGIAGLPLVNPEALAEEQRLVDTLLGLGCTIGYQRLESQPGALVTEHPEHFAMVSEARSFDDFMRFFAALEPGDASVPMVRYADAAMEAQVEETASLIDEAVWAAAERTAPPEWSPSGRWVTTAERHETTLGAWLGSYAVPAAMRATAVTVLRGRDGLGVAVAPSLTAKTALPGVLGGEEARAILEVVAAMARPAPGALVKGRRSQTAAQRLAAGRLITKSA
jgi:hypothetical protein